MSDINFVDLSTFIAQTNGIASAINTEQPILFSANGVMYQAQMHIEGGKQIIPYAYFGCDKLEKITINYEYDVTAEFDNPFSYAFKGCTALETLDITCDYLDLSEEAFSGCTKLEEATLTCEEGYIGDSVFLDCANLTSLTISCEQVVGIGSYTFENTPFDNGTGGTVYVPQALVSAYEADSAWSALSSTTFAAIEEMNND